MLNVLYVVPRCRTWSDRYYELLSAHIDKAKIIFLPQFFNYCPFLIILWRLFSYEFKNSHIIHANCENGLFLYSPFKKLVVTFHHDIFDKLFFQTLPFYKKIYYIIFNKIFYLSWMLLASRVVFVNRKDYVKYSAKYFWLKDKALNIMNGLDTNEIRCIKPDFFSEKIDQKRVLFVGKKTSRKWWNLVESMFSLVHFPEIKLYCTSLAGNILKSNFFQDFWCLPRSDLLKLIKSVDIVFLPSKIEWFSYTIAEALSLWTPVLTTQDWADFSETFPHLFHLLDKNDSSEIILSKILSIPKMDSEILNFDTNPYHLDKSVLKYVYVYKALLQENDKKNSI